MLVYLFILVNEIAEAALAFLIPTLFPKDTILLFFLLYTTQVIFAPIQGGLSDHYCRKKSLAVAFILVAFAFGAILISQIYGMFWFLLGVILYGMIGNIEVISRAALLDIYTHKSRHKIMGWSFFVESIPWMMIPLIMGRNISASKVFAGITICALLFFLIVLYKFRDFRDLEKHKKPHHLIINDIRAIFNYFKSKIFLALIIGFLLLELVYQLIFYFQDDYVQPRNLEIILMFIMGIGFAMGTVIQIFLKQKDKKIILLGASIVGVALVYLLYVSNYIEESRWLFLGGGFYFISLASGIYLPRIYSLFSYRHHLHEQGKVVGLLSSIQTLGEMLAIMVLMKFVMPDLNYFLIMQILFVVIAFYIYLRYTKENSISSRR